MTLLWLALAFIAGIVLGPYLALAPTFVIWFAPVFVALAWFLRASKWKLWLLMAAFACVGLARSSHGSSPPSAGDVAFYNGRSVSLQGLVSAEPDIRDKGIIYQISVLSLSYRGHAEKVSGRVELHTPRSQVLEYGDSVSLTGHLQQPQNTAALPYKDILARRGIGSEMSFPRVLDLGPSHTGWMGWVVPLRQHLENGIDEWLPEPEAALLIAITLGAHSASLGSLTSVLVATGLIHIIAISGIKVALVAGTLLALVRPFGQRLLSLLLPLGALWFYVLITGATAAGERSALMWTLYFLAVYLGRQTVPLVSITFAVAVMVALDPALPWDIGFQLTVFGTIAILVYSDYFLRLFRPVPSPFREALAVTTAAQIGTLPIVIIGFHVVSATGPLANALILPLLPILIALGFILGVCSGIGQLAAPVSSLAYVLLHASIVTSSTLARLRPAFPASAWSPAFEWLYYGILGGVSWWVVRRVGLAPARLYRMNRRDLAGAFFLAASLLTVTAVQGDRMSSKLFALGTGEAKVVMSQGRVALVDGSPSPFTLLERLSAILSDRRTIDVVVVTNPSASNMTGLNEVLNHYRVAEVVDTGSEHPTSTYSRWRATLRERNIPSYALRTHVAFQLGSVRITSLGPDAVCSLPSDCEGLLRVSTRNQSMLLTSTASNREQIEAVFRPVDLRANILLSDSAKSLAPAFVRAVNAQSLFENSTAPFMPTAKRMPTGSLTSWSL